MTPVEKQQQFEKELKELLKKFDASMEIEDLSIDYGFEDNKIVVDFNFDEKMFEEHGTGIAPQLVIGRFFDFTK
jgi:hypothetical protein